MQCILTYYLLSTQHTSHGLVAIKSDLDTRIYNYSTSASCIMSKVQISPRIFLLALLSVHCVLQKNGNGASNCIKKFNTTLSYCIHTALVRYAVQGQIECYSDNHCTVLIFGYSITSNARLQAEEICCKEFNVLSYKSDSSEAACGVCNPSGKISIIIMINSAKTENSQFNARVPVCP